MVVVCERAGLQRREEWAGLIVNENRTEMCTLKRNNASVSADKPLKSYAEGVERIMFG